MRYRVISQIERPDPALVERFRHVAIPMIARELGRSQVVDPRIKPVGDIECFLCGPAVTVKLEALDLLMGYTAPKVCQPGDVIVVAAQGNTEVAVWGGSMTRSAESVGCAGVVVDGAHEATRSLLERKLPVYSRGSSLATPPVNQGGSINVPVSCGNVVVYPGDLMLGHRDGVIVVPREEMEEIITRAEQAWAEVKAGNQFIAEQPGKTYFDYRNMMERLEALGVEWT